MPKGRECRSDKMRNAQPKDCDVYCRICASHSQEMLGIFSEEDGNGNIAEKIGRCLPIIVLPNDNLPLCICQSCANQLNASYDLILTSLKAEVFFKSNFSFANNQFSEETQCYDLLSEKLQEEKQPEQTLSTVCQDVNQKLVICEVILEDDGSVKIRSTEKTRGKKRKRVSFNASYLNAERDDAEGNSEYEPLREKFTVDSLFPSLNINGPATCDICHMKFSDMDAFDEHVSNFHLLKFNWKCRLCDVGFENSEELLSHKIKKHPDNLLSCENCYLKNSECKNVVIKEECLEENDDVNFKCNILNAKSITKSNFYSVIVENDNRTNVAPKKISRKMEFSKPDLSATPKSKYTSNMNIEKFCKVCEKYFKGQFSWLVHKKRCRNENEAFSVPDKEVCEGSIVHVRIKEEGEKNALVTVVEDETNQKKAFSKQCVTCHKVFTSEILYKKHRYIHDPECWDRYKCKECSRPFCDAQALANHMKVHSSVKRHMCDLCGRTFNRHANMMKHRKLHKPSNQWTDMCAFCQAKFENLNDLKVHVEQSHGSSISNDVSVLSKSNNKQWICRFCGKRISTKLSLEDHERIHTGVKPYICEWCGREFRCRPNLLQHQVIHTGVRKHTCEVCGKKFSRKSFLAQHLRVHTGERPFQCNICGHRFTQSGDMQRHRRRHFIEKTNSVCSVDVPKDDKALINVKT